MINKERVSLESFPVLRHETAKKREDKTLQDEALNDTRTLRQFALEHQLFDDAVELFLEEALIQQHFLMNTKDQKYLQEMKKVVDETDEYIQKNQLSQWESRLARFQGRLADYDQKYQEAATFYQEAIAKVSLDPKFKDNQALSFEYEGFLVIDQLRLGQIETAITQAFDLYQKYEQSPTGQSLKTRDYTTWAIWRTGVLINLSRTLIDLGKQTEYRNKIVEWLNLAEKDLQPPVNTQTWSDFGFRKDEIAKIKEAL